MESEGTFRCEVVGDAPNFELLRDERHMKVYCKYQTCIKLVFMDAKTCAMTQTLLRTNQQYAG